MSTAVCKSHFCAVQGGREFEVPAGASGVEAQWCPMCLRVARQVQFFSQQTAAMIRNKYREYNETNLPKEVKLILTQFARELVNELGEEEL